MDKISIRAKPKRVHKTFLDEKKPGEKIEEKVEEITLSLIKNVYYFFKYLYFFI